MRLRFCPQIRLVLCLVLSLTSVLSSCDEPKNTKLPAVGTGSVPASSTQARASTTASYPTQVPTKNPRLILTASPSAPRDVTPAPISTLRTAAPVSSTLTATSTIAGEIHDLAEREIFYLDGGSSPREIWKADIWTGEKVRVFHNDTPGFEVNNLVLSPSKEFLVLTFLFYDPIDGRTLLRSGLQTIRPDGSKLITLVQTEETNWVIDAPVWSPDSNHVAYLRAYLPEEGEASIQELHVLSLRTGQDKMITPQGGLCDWSPDGNSIVYASENRGGIYVVDFASGNQKTLWEDTNLMFGWPAWQPNGEHVAVTVINKDTDMPPSQAVGVYLLDVSSQERAKLSDASTFHPQWSPNSQQMLYDVFVPGGGQLWLVDISGRPPIEVLNKLVVLGTPAWSSNGHVVLLAVSQTAYESYWVSVMNTQDSNLTHLALTQGIRPQSTW